MDKEEWIWRKLICGFWGGFERVEKMKGSQKETPL